MFQNDIKWLKTTSIAVFLKQNNTKLCFYVGKLAKLSKLFYWYVGIWYLLHISTKRTDSERLHCRCTHNHFAIIINGINYCMMPLFWSLYKTHLKLLWLAQFIISHLNYSNSIVNVEGLVIICLSHLRWNNSYIYVIIDIIIYYHIQKNLPNFHFLK